MRVITKATLNMHTMEWTSIESYEYSGPVALCGGGASSEQKAAAARQEEQTKADMATQAAMLQIYKDQYAKINPFETSILNKGLPFMRQLTD